MSRGNPQFGSNLLCNPLCPLASIHRHIPGNDLHKAYELLTDATWHTAILMKNWMPLESSSVRTSFVQHMLGMLSNTHDLSAACSSSLDRNGTVDPAWAEMIGTVNLQRAAEHYPCACLATSAAANLAQLAFDAAALVSLRRTGRKQGQWQLDTLPSHTKALSKVFFCLCLSATPVS